MQQQIKHFIKSIFKSHKEVRIVCVGNPIRSDDGVGPYICSILEKEFPEIVLNCEIAVEYCSLNISRECPNAIVLIDAVKGVGDPGSVIYGEYSKLPEKGVRSTHDIPWETLVQYISKLCNKEIKVYIIGIEPYTTDVGMELSDVVSNVAKQVAAAILEALREVLGSKQ